MDEQPDPADDDAQRLALMRAIARTRVTRLRTPFTPAAGYTRPAGFTPAAGFTRQAGFTPNRT
jgi:hypothetical protein